MARRKVNPPNPIVIARVTHRKPKKTHEKRNSKDKDFQNHSRPFYWIPAYDMQYISRKQSFTDIGQPPIIEIIVLFIILNSARPQSFHPFCLSPFKIPRSKPPPSNDQTRLDTIQICFELVDNNSMAFPYQRVIVWVYIKHLNLENNSRISVFREVTQADCWKTHPNSARPQKYPSMDPWDGFKNWNPLWKREKIIILLKDIIYFES